MMKETKRVKVRRVTEEGGRDLQDTVVRESTLTIFLNDRELVTLLCTPAKLDYLAVGFLFSEGLIMTKREIKRVTMDERRGAIWVETKRGKEPPENFLSKRYITTGCGRGMSFLSPPEGGFRRIDSKARVSSEQIHALMTEFQRRSFVHQRTGGVHSAAICTAEEMLVFAEDIGRHNAIDKALGECLLSDIAMKNRVLITSGRVSSEILMKTARSGIPVIVSKAAPTDAGIMIARKCGITLIGFARGSRMNIYSENRRIKE